MNRFRIDNILNMSWRVGRLFDIPISLHITLIFFLLAAYPRTSVLSVVESLEFVVGIVLSILCHELGHALVAKSYGLRDLSIMIHGLGGYAMSSGSRSPGQQLVISLAGPAVTFVLAGLGTAIIYLVHFPAALAGQAHVIDQLAWLNLFLGLLNLVPCLPWDGGTALQCMISFKQGDLRATRAVAWIGLILCPFGLVAGFFLPMGLPFLFALIGFVTSYMTLKGSGGFKFDEMFGRKRKQQEWVARQKMDKDKHIDFMDAVKAREQKRADEERLRRLLGEDDRK